MIVTPKHGIFTSPSDNFKPGPWSVFVDDKPIVEDMNESFAMNQFKASCNHYEYRGRVVEMRKNGKWVYRQPVK